MMKNDDILDHETNVRCSRTGCDKTNHHTSSLCGRWGRGTSNPRYYVRSISSGSVKYSSGYEAEDLDGSSLHHYVYFCELKFSILCNEVDEVDEAEERVHGVPRCSLRYFVDHKRIFIVVTQHHK